jgi:GAF domain-containing protein
MDNTPLYEDDEDFVPRRPATGEDLLSASGQIAVADLLALIVSEPGDRAYHAKQAAEIIRRVGPYRWVGIYDISPDEAQVFAWSGLGPPAFMAFPVTAGLTGEAIRSRSTVVANDVSKDSRYLTSFASTRAEIIVPVLDATGSKVVGTIDVESDRENAFRRADQQVLEQCAVALAPLWR